MLSDLQVERKLYDIEQLLIKLRSAQTGQDSSINSLQKQITDLTTTVNSTNSSKVSDSFFTLAGGILTTIYNLTLTTILKLSGTVKFTALTASRILKLDGTNTVIADQIDLTSSNDVKNALGAAHGGTGLATLTAHNVILGEGTSAVSFAAPGVAGTVLMSNGVSADPTFQAPAVASVFGRTGAVVANTGDYNFGQIAGATQNGQLFLTAITVASLPAAASNKGFIYLVSDANTPVLGNTVAGGGTKQVLVISDGTNWIVS